MGWFWCSGNNWRVAKFRHDRHVGDFVADYARTLPGSRYGGSHVGRLWLAAWLDRYWRASGIDWICVYRFVVCSYRIVMCIVDFLALAA